MWCGKGPFPANKKNSDYIFLPEWKRRPTRRRGSSSIGTRESVRTSSIVRRFSPFVTRRAFVCFILSFRHEISFYLSGMKFAMSSWNFGGAKTKYFLACRNAISNPFCSLRPANQRTNLTRQPALSLSLVVWQWNSPRYLAWLSLQSRHSSATFLSIYWALH